MSHTVSRKGLTPCTACPDVDTHLAKLWWPCEQPERPLDDHGLFDVGGRLLTRVGAVPTAGCPGCVRAWIVLGCPRADLVPAP